MKVSQKTEYALRAMLELALRYGGRATRSAGIAKTQRIPEKFLELILVELRRAGLVVSQRGPEGGHRLARPAQDISVGDIWRAIEGPLGSTGKPVSTRPDPFQSVWAAVDKSVANVVDNVSLAEIQQRAEARQNVPDFNI